MPRERVKIILTNGRSRILVAPGSTVLDELRERTRIKAKGYFFSPAYRKRQWDGYVNYVTEKTGSFETGLLQEMIDHLKDMKIKYTIEDNRDLFSDQHEVDNLGGMYFFKHQLESLNAVLENKVEGLKYQRGILNEATNAGKSLIAAGIYSSFAKKRTGLFLVNGKELFDQAVADLEKLLPGQVGQVSSKTFMWKRINVCMVQTLGNRIKNNPTYRNLLAKIDIIIVDEADEIMGRKDCKEILSICYNAPVRIALTGTADKSKDKNRNKALIAWFGPILHKITNKELVDLGISTKPDIRIYTGNTHVRRDGDWKGEYMRGIVKNKRRNKRIWKRVLKHSSKKRLPILILYKNHKHAIKLMECCPPELLKKYNIRYVHHKTKDRKIIFQKFNDGKIDILLSSMIIKRGKNLPLIRALINAAAGDSETTILQIFGRAIRKHKSKNKVYVEDFWDIGKYLRRHSRHRVIYYKNQNFQVREIYKKRA